MNDDEDLELAALERKLDDAFQTTRPRANFEDELWLRMQSTRPLWSRLQDMVTGLFDSVREAPAIPAAAVAAVLIVALGVGIVSLSGNLRGGGGGTTAMRNSEDGAAQYGSGPFGPVPAPGIQPATAPALSGGPKVSGPEYLSGAVVYYGPAKLTWSGKLDSSLASAPVFRYEEPQESTAAGFAQRAGATSHSTPAGSDYLGSYSSRDFTLVVRGTIRTPSSEPAYLLTLSAPGAPSPLNDPVQIAKAFLQAHNLTPDWPYVVVTEQSGSLTHVHYLRQFDLPGSGDVDAVDGTGSQYGIQVDVQNSSVLTVSGPLPLPLDSALYSLISNDQAVQSALSSVPSAPGTGSMPAVALTSAKLVYALAVDGEHSYFEPAFLFSGSFTMNGQTYVKRVLVPAVVPSQLSS